jgi:ABC-2 type transport system ATP-binding protein
MTAAAVQARALTVLRRGRAVLRQLDFEIQGGVIAGLIGPSGCGKTTLMRCLVGVQSVSEGSLTVLGRPAGDAALRRRLGYASQAAAIYGDLSVIENLRYFASVLGAPASDPERVMEEVGLLDQREHRVANLSGGQVSRVSLAIALLGEPELLVLDEPTVGLDPVLREELWSLFRRLVQQRGVTMLVSSHVMDEAERCDTLILMREGRILAADTPQAMCAKTQTTTVEKAFLRLVREQPLAGIRA